MAFTKITEADIENKGVRIQNNPMELPVSEAQRVFDELALDAIIPKFNALSAELDIKETGWDTAATNEHTHSNKTVLDGVTDIKVGNWDSAFGKEHSHSNKAELDLVTSGDVAKWNGKADATNVILKDNATPFTPAGMYQPATKKYVDDTVVAIGAADMTQAVYDPNGMRRDVFAYSTPRTSGATSGNMAQFGANGALSDSGIAFSIHNGGLRVTYDDGL